MIRRPPRSTRKESSAASDVYKRQNVNNKLHNEKKESHEASSIVTEEKQIRKKRGKRIGKRNKRVTTKNDVTNADQTNNNNVLAEDKNQKNSEMIKKENNKDKNLEEVKKNIDENNPINPTKPKKVKSVKKNKDQDLISKNNINNKNDPEQIIVTEKNDRRIAQTSSPIEVTKIDESSNTQKPKRKGWWSK